MVVRVRSVAMPGCYYGSRSIGSWDPEDPGQEAETQNMHLGFVVIQRLTASPTDDALHGTRSMPYLSRCLSLIVRTATDATATWRCAVPNGTYAVVMVAGDPISPEHSNHWSLNSQNLIDPDPYDPAATPGYARGDYDGWAIDVTVTDGYLTLAPSAGAFDPALCLIEIGPPGSAVDDGLRTKLAGIIERASNRTAGDMQLHPPTPRTYAYGGDYIDAPLAMKAGQGAMPLTLRGVKQLP